MPPYIKLSGVALLVALGFWEPSFWFALPMFFWGCETCACAADCACTDDYSASGTGGEGRDCPFTGGESLAITGGELIGVSPNTIVFDENGPDTNEVSTTVITIVTQPSDSDGPSTIQLRAGIDGGSYVYGQLAMTAGDVSISVGTQDGELESNEDADTGGIAEPITLSLCWKPWVETGTIDSVFVGAETRSGGTDWNDADNVLGYNDNTYAWHGPLASGNQTPAIGIGFFPILPNDATLTGFSAEVRCRQVANPGNDPIVSEAVISAGGSSSADLSAGESVPSPNFGVLTWGGAGNLCGISTTAAAINSTGMGFSIRFQFTVDNDGDIDIDHIVVAVYFTAPLKGPGRVTLTYTKGMTTACVTTQTTSGEGGGFPGISFIADTWDVDSVEIECNSDSCEASCGDRVDCASECCSEEGSDDLTEELVLGGFETGVSACCSHNAADYTLEFATPTSDASDGCAWVYGDIVNDCEPFEDGNSFFIQALLYSPASSGCLWEVTINCFDGLDLSFTAKYRSAEIVDDECDGFPITLTLFSEINPDGVTLPETITLDNT